MKKKILSLLLAVVMVLGMVPVAALADSAPSFEKVSMTLDGILGINFKVNPNGADMSGYSVAVTVGDETQTITSYTLDGSLCCYTADLMAHKMHQSVSAVLLCGEETVEETTFLVADYVSSLKEASSNASLHTLLDAMVSYGTYAEAYAAESTASDETVDAVDSTAVEAYAAVINANDSALGLKASLYLDDACDLRIKFNADAFDGCELYIDGEAISAESLTEEDGKLVYALEELLPQSWTKLYSICIKNGDEMLADVSYGVMSYAYTHLCKTQEVKTGLSGLLKAMYLYGEAAKAYTPDVEEAIELPETVLLDAASWSAGGTAGDRTLTVPANSSLSASALQTLWEAGYTHLTFTVDPTDGVNYTHGGSWQRYWRNLTAGVEQTLRIDLNEFHDGDTWYTLNFASGEMIVSNVKAYSSAETLEWTKIGDGEPSNVYFAIEDGYYVLETITGQGVTSPTEWLEKYCVADDASQRSWKVYTDYITVGNNTRSILWGWGSAVNNITDVSGGWTWLSGMQTDGYTEGEVFSLHTDSSATARFKILDWVSNRNQWNDSLALEYVDEQTVSWSGAADYKIRYAPTQDLIAAGATALNVTVTGDVGDAQLWYGDDAWSNGEIGFNAGDFTDGSYSFTVDLTAFVDDGIFTIFCSASSVTDLQIHVEPVYPVVYSVTAPTGEGYTFSGETSVAENGSYSFTVTPDENVLVTVYVNGVELTGTDNVYTIQQVTSDLVITVETKVITALDKLLMAESWSAGGTVGSGTLTVPANSSLSASALEALWDEGYTHLTFTVDPTDGVNYTHGGSWQRYWRNLTAGVEQTLRIDLNEFHDGDTWYTLNFASGEMVVSNVKAYSSAETLEWTKIGDGEPSNVYFAIEDGYYVLETITGQGVTSPTEWLEKYCVADDASQRSWKVYTDYITVGNNTRSILWGWGSAVNNITDVSGGWTWLSGMQTDGYTEGEVFSLHTDSSATARFKILDWVSNRNQWNDSLALEYVDEQTVSWSGAADYKIRYAPTQDLIAAGATALNVTVTGDVGDAQLWYGDDAWSNGEIGFNAGDFTDGSYSFTVDLTAFVDDGIFTIFCSASSVTDLQIHVEPVMGGTKQVKKAIVLSSDTPTAVGTALANELNSVGTGYAVYTAAEAESIDAKNSIIFGSNFNGVTFQDVSNGESYAIEGDGTNIYIDGNCVRALVYGAFDLLRSLGYEFYTSDVTVRPASLELDYSVSIADSADFAVRSYLTDATSYNEDSLTDQTFTVASKHNNELFAAYESFGGGVSYESFGGGVHNFGTFFADHTEGKYGNTVATGVGSETGFAPCLTNGVTYNVGADDTTLTYAAAKLKEAILANPDTYYFGLCQDDGPTWYCGCDYCVADAESHNHSGTLVSFLGAVAALLDADPDLAGRDYRIVTLAYSFTADAPQNISSISDKLLIWYAQWHNANYSINSDSQDLYSYKENLRAWAELTADENLALWLYDTSFENYLAYFTSINTIAQTIADAKALGVSNIMVLGAYNAENIWHSEMKSYIWSKLLWDSSLDVATLQSDFLKAYFGEDAYSSAQTFVDLYDDNIGSAANKEDGYPICSGYGYYCHKNVFEQSTVHSKALDAANAALSAIAAGSGSDEEKAAYTKRVNGLLATVYGSVVANWTGYEGWHDAILGSDRFSDFEAYFGSSISDCQALVTAAAENAGITMGKEGSSTFAEWLAYISDLYSA